jgi:four helix bundle protein
MKKDFRVQYKHLEIWKLAHALVLDIYIAIEPLPQHEDNNIKSQLRRAVTCLPLNIAEGSGARSPKIFLNFLIFCYRSVRETEALLILSRDLNYFTQDDFSKLKKQLDTFTRKLCSFMDYLENNVIKTKRKKDVSHFYRQQSHIIKREQMGRLA